MKGKIALPFHRCKNEPNNIEALTFGLLGKEKAAQMELR